MQSIGIIGDFTGLGNGGKLHSCSVVDDGLVRQVAEAMFAAVRGKPGADLWGEIEPVVDAYRRSAEAAIDVIKASEVQP